MTQKVIIYSTKVCPYCIRAKKLLDAKGVMYEEIDVSDNDALRKTMTEKAGGRTSVPQIFIGDRHVGGFDDLNALNQAGKLDGMLQ